MIFRLGRVKKNGAVGPGLFVIIPCIDTIQVVDLRTVSFNVPPQEILSKDSVRQYTVVARVGFLAILIGNEDLNLSLTHI